MSTTDPRMPTTNNALWSAGFSLLVLGMSVGGLARSLRVSDTISISMSIASGLLSAAAIVVFVKASKNRRSWRSPRSRSTSLRNSRNGD